MINSSRMNLINLYRRESRGSGLSMAVIAAIAGASNALVLGIINAAATTASSQETDTRVFFMFVIAIALFVYTKRYILIRSIVLIEDIIHNVRVRLANKVRHSELQKLESIGQSEIYSRITKETETISQTATPIIDACQSAILIFFCMIYIAWMSRFAFFLTIAVLALGVAYYFFQRRELTGLLRESSQKEIEFFDSLSDILNGFKEVKMNRRKSDSVFGELKAISASNQKIKIKTGTGFMNNYIFSQVFFYILIGVIVFILPRMSATYVENVVKIVTAILFMIGPVSSVVTSIQLFAQANVAVDNIYRLEQALGDLNGTFTGPVADVSPFKEIRSEQITFSYKDAAGRALFQVGPIDFTISAGEILFVVGGNGSGKSTFLKLLTGLYFPDNGRLHLDRIPLEAAGYSAYRELFSVIFTDYHLFRRLHGLDSVDERRLKDFLRMFEIDRKTAYVDGKFTSLELSGGQRKRLALIAALMEDRPILLLDEWAADQDPGFRKFFYEEILQDLKKRGKTVIAVTHDDRYFHTADRVMKLDFGRIVPA